MGDEAGRFLDDPAGHILRPDADFDAERFRDPQPYSDPCFETEPQLSRVMGQTMSRHLEIYLLSFVDEIMNILFAHFTIHQLTVNAH